MQYSTVQYDTFMTDVSRRIMAERNVDCCVFTSYHNIAYYSNFVYCAFGRPYGLVCK